jgi:cytochrome c biogenesis protein CcmG/thiol:disulfide interchange protein DsbE
MTTRRAMLAHAAAALSVLAVEGGAVSAARANSIRIGRAAPPASLTTLDGRRMATADLLGRVVVLTFWATWCVPCREELPLLSDYAARHQAQGLSVLGFSLDGPDKLPQVRQIAASLSFPVGLMSDSSAPGYGRMWKLPVSFTIDRRGILIDDGWKAKQPSWSAERLALIVTPLL